MTRKKNSTDKKKMAITLKMGDGAHKLKLFERDGDIIEGESHELEVKQTITKRSHQTEMLVMIQLPSTWTMLNSRSEIQLYVHLGDLKSG